MMVALSSRLSALGSQAVTPRGTRRLTTVARPPFFSCGLSLSMATCDSEAKGATLTRRGRKLERSLWQLGGDADERLAAMSSAKRSASRWASFVDAAMFTVYSRCLGTRSPPICAWGRWPWPLLGVCMVGQCARG